MKICDVKINGFGKLTDTSLKFNSGINIVTGNNECGKTTFSKCIEALLFGIERNKNGKTISDFDKYSPWNASSFSAKIGYCLDNGDKFEVFRDFSKRSTKVFNANLEDISALYSIDNAKNSNFFVEQTNISKDIFDKTAIIAQQETKLNKLEQNVILQKLSNLVSTGDDTISFKKVLDKLNKKQLDEIGTTRSSAKPLNIILSKIEACKLKLKDFEVLKDEYNSTKAELDNLQNELNGLKRNISLLKELQNIRNNERMFMPEIDSLQNIISDYDEKLIKIDNDIQDIEHKNKKHKNLCLIASGLFVILAAVTFAVFSSWPILAIFIGLAILSFAFSFKKIPISGEKLFLQNAQREKENELKALINKLKTSKEGSNTYIKNTYGENPFLNMDFQDICNKLAEFENVYSEKMLNFNTRSLHLKSLASQIDELTNCQDELNGLNEELANLTFLNNAMNLAREALTEAYEEIKHSITPKFTAFLSEFVSKVTNNKYSNIAFNDTDGLVVQLDNGNYVNVELLSLGTIDQMYISLRLTALKEISKENLPIILDDSLVYFDDFRLQNFLEFLSKEFEQVIIFSCSNREKELLDKLSLPYTLHRL